MKSWISMPSNAFKVLAATRDHRRASNLDAAELKRVREWRLRSLVAHAWNNVPLYRDLWSSAGIVPGDIRTQEDFQRLPIVTKEMLRAAYPHASLSRTARPGTYKEIATTGSTGQMMRIAMDNSKELSEVAIASPLFISQYQGLKIRRPAMVVDGGVEAFESASQRLFPFTRKWAIDAMAPVEKIVEFLVRRNPDAIASYPTIMTLVCQYADSHGIQLPRPHTVFLGAEAVTPGIRAMIRKSFGAQVLNSYAATEAGYIGFERPGLSGFHLLHWKVLLELVDDDGAPTPHGELGNVVITDLHNRSTPIIRYRGLGDLGRFCPDSPRDMPVLASLEGRKVERVLDVAGQRVNPFLLTSHLQKYEEIGRYQIRQEERERVRVLIELINTTGRTPTLESTLAGRFERIKGTFRQHLGESMQVDVSVVDRIPNLAGTSKTPIVVSLI
jgi:phenylacetate-CoA ligase